MVPGAWAWQPPPEGTRGCPRVSSRLVRCQAGQMGLKAASRSARLGETWAPRNLGGVGRGHGQVHLQSLRLTPRGRCTVLSPSSPTRGGGCTTTRLPQGERQPGRRLAAGSGDSSARRSSSPSRTVTQSPQALMLEAPVAGGRRDSRGCPGHPRTPW